MKTCLLLSALLCGVLWRTSSAAERTFHTDRFGDVTIYEPPEPAKSVALFVSGDGGWNLGVVGMARTLSESGAVVVGIDIRKYLQALNVKSTGCTSPAVDLEQLSHTVQKELRLPAYRIPQLVGYSSGATLVYAALAQAPRGTFAGALSLGFCPDLQLPHAPCRGDGLTFTRGRRGELVFAPRHELPEPWILLQGVNDQVCDAKATAAFAAQIAGARVIELPQVGHGFSVERRWAPQFRRAYADLAAVPPPIRTDAERSVNLEDLPLSEVPAGAGGEVLALFITGDGGWAGLDQNVSAELARRGIPVVGLSSLKYFWRARTPDGAAHDVADVLRHYLAAWRRTRIALIGYSFGADVMPFIVNRLPADLRARVMSVSLLGLSKDAAFEVSVGSLVHASGGRGATPVAPELSRLETTPVLCIYGEGEQESLCPSLEQRNVKTLRIGRGHHFSGDYRALAQAIVSLATRSGASSEATSR
jgi:type IV secretory pathway VirJ component